MKHWKKLLSLALTLALALSLAGCGKTDTADTESEEAQEETQVQEEQAEEAVSEHYAIAALKGPTAMGLVKLMSDTDEKAAQMLDSSEPYEGEVGNLYTFSLAIELIILHISMFLVMMHAYVEVYQQGKSEYKKTTSCMNKIFALIGWGVLIYVIWITITKSHDLLSISNVKIFLLPVFLTILSLPYFYIVALIIGYSNVSWTIRCVQRDKPLIAKAMIKATKKYANVNLKRLSRIRQYCALFDPTKDSVSDYIKRISRKPRYTIGHTARFYPRLRQRAADCYPE